MLSPQFSSDLISSLALRARGNHSSLLLDRAASLLASQLGLDTLQALNGSERAALQRSEWVDQQILDFLKKHPNALGVDLNAGVSTRFHRLSSALDWPQFRWADINTPETQAFSQSLLPVTDNYRSIGCDMYQDDWLFRAGWQPSRPLIIVVESFAEPHKMANLISELSERAVTSIAPVMIVITCSSDTSHVHQQLPLFDITQDHTFQNSTLLTFLSRIAAKIGITLPVDHWRGMRLDALVIDTHA